MQCCAHGSAPVGALLWAQHALCASDWFNFVLICNIADGLLDYAKVIAYLATHSQTNTYQSPQNRWHSSSHPPPAQESYRLQCWIVALRHYVTWLSPRVRRFFVIQEYLECSRGRKRCIKECATAVAQVTGALLNATRLSRQYCWPHNPATRFRPPSATVVVFARNGDTAVPAEGSGDLQTLICPCGETQTMSHIVESCPLTKLNGGLSRLHSADEDAVSWLTSYG